MTPKALLPLMLLALLGGSSAIAHAQLTTKGRWSKVDHTKWSPGDETEATHMVVLRGNGDSTRVLYFHDWDDTRLWLWNPTTDTASASVRVPNILPGAEENDFCSGLLTLADGRGMIIGGTAFDETGSRNISVFDPTDYGPGNDYGWSNQDQTVFGRWYPQATLLGSGKALIMSGHDYYNVTIFGGTDDAGAYLDEMRRFRMRADDEGWHVDPTTSRPAAREGHVAAYDAARKQMIVWGGRDSSGTDTLTTIWRLRRTDTDAGERWEWEALGRGLPDLATGGFPTPRAGAAAARLGGSRASPSNIQLGDTLVIFGGRRIVDASSAALDTLWLLNLATLRWTQVIPQAGEHGAAGPRYDHIAVMDPGQCLGVGSGDAYASTCTQGTPVPRLIVHGGRLGGGSLATDTTWALSIPRAGSIGTPQWSAIATGGPAARAGHSAMRQPHRTTGYSANCGDARIEFFLYGGQDGGGTKSDLWHLSRADSTSAPQPWAWRQVTTGSTAPGCRPTPPPRMDHVGVYDRELHRMIVIGGDTTGTGVRANDVWSLSMNFSRYCGSSVPPWVCATTDSAPSQRSGHTAIQDPEPVFARVPERYTYPKVGSQAQSESLTFAQKRQPFYPHMYLLRSGRLFWTGNTDSAGSPSYDLDLGDVGRPWQNQRLSGVDDTDTLVFIGGGSAIVRADSIMKCGGNNVTGNATAIPNGFPRRRLCRGKSRRT